MRVGQILLVVALFTLLWLNLRPTPISDNTVGFIESESTKPLPVLQDSTGENDIQKKIDQTVKLKHDKDSPQATVADAEGFLKDLPASVTSDALEKKIPTPDELFKRQQQIVNIDNELPATIPDMLVVSSELRELELRAGLVSINGEYQDSYKEPLPDNPDRPYESTYLAEIPASEDFMIVIPFELDQLEQQEKYVESSGEANEYGSNVPLFDNPDTGDINSQTELNIEMPIESERNANLE